MERRAALRFLLIGGTGYIGGRLAEYLKGQGHYVRVTTRRPLGRALSWLQADDVVNADPLKETAWRRAFSSIDVVIDLAAPDEVRAAQHPLEGLQAGVEGTWNVLQALAKLPHPPSFLYLSTFHVYGRNAHGHVSEQTTPAPSHPYALGKYIGECVVQTFRRQKKVAALCVRLANTFGASAGNQPIRESLVFNDLCRQAVRHKKLVLKSTGRQQRNFIPLFDAVRALEFLSLRHAEWPGDGIMHVGGASHWSIREVASLVAQSALDVLGYRPPVVVPAHAVSEKAEPFRFSVERLKGLGFTWTDPWEQEIRATLHLYQNASPRRRGR